MHTPFREKLITARSGAGSRKAGHLLWIVSTPAECAYVTVSCCQGTSYGMKISLKSGILR